MTARDETDNQPGEPAARPDEESDPGLDDEEGSDWSDEGGAVDEGPATATDEPGGPAHE
ncbi:MAG: hypothetical protein WB767_05990 [Nocardioides sp.]